MSYGEIGGLIVISLIALFFVFICLDWPSQAEYKYKAAKKSYWAEKHKQTYGPIHKSSSDEIARHEYDHREDEKGFWVTYIALSTITIMVAAVGAAFAYGAFSAARDQANSANKTLTSIQRAFITVSKLSISGPDKSGVWIVDPVVVNSGSTPTVNFHYQIGFGGNDMNTMAGRQRAPFRPPKFSCPGRSVEKRI